MSISPITLTGSTTAGMSTEEVDRLRQNVQIAYNELHPRESSRPESEVYALIQRHTRLDARLQELAQRYSDIETVLAGVKTYAAQNEQPAVRYLKEARKVLHGALVKAATDYLNQAGLEGASVPVERGLPVRIVRADVLLGTNEDPALPLSMVIAAIDRACAEGGVQLPAAVIAALPHQFAQMRAALSSKPAVVKKQR